ncbi:MAG: branched-chain amino acid ABC transporter permease [Neoaquamicrobium sediminum]|uniref:branched-chain amino acid ABC transporter permease n=1 Tax=Neoaquamicrobium sediminum TaxID=1849104 RepID=UPI00403528DD
MEGFLNALVVFANFVFIPGLAYGAQLALGALGVTLVFGILRFSNFAHGDLMAFGTMITILVTWWLIGMGVTLGPLPTALLALPIGIIGAVAMALLIDRLVFRFYRKQKSPGIVFVMASVGVMFVLNGIVRLIIGPNDQRFADGERFLVTVRGFREYTGLAEGLAIRLPVAITVIVAVIVVVALFWFLQYSRTGKAMRAYSDNEDLALLSGINPDKVVMVTWIIAAALATIAGVLYGLDKSFRPFTYFQLLLPIFAAAIVGGIGQPLGAIAGGFVVAFSEVTLTYAYKRVLEYLGFQPEGLVQLLSTEYKFAISFVILVLVLLIRPTGIFKGRVL